MRNSTYFAVSLDQGFSHPWVDFVAWEDTETDPAMKEDIVQRSFEYSDELYSLHDDFFLELNPAARKQNNLRLETCFQKSDIQIFKYFNKLNCSWTTIHEIMKMNLLMKRLIYFKLQICKENHSK